MKRTPRMQRIEELMRSSQLVAGGFLGDDARPLEEVIEADAAQVVRLGTDCQTIAGRMSELRDRANEGLGTAVPVGDTLEVAADDNRGVIVCPWGDNTRHFKTVTTVRHLDTGEVVRWSDLCIHLIAEHGFFQGKGSLFRLEPAELVRVLW